MKKILFSFMALACAAMTFTACEDVPAPYDVFNEEDTEQPTIVVAEGSGTSADPFNVAAAIEKCKEVGTTESTEKYYIKGKVAATTPSDDSYGNATFDIVDYEGGSTFKCYQVAGTDGKKLPNGFVFNKGDEVVVYGAIYNYNGKTPETVGKGAAYVVSVNGQSTDSGSSTPVTPTEGNGKGTADNPYDVTAAISAGSGTGVYVKGYIVGSVSGQVLAEGAAFSATTEVQSNILIAASANETDVTKCMPVQLPNGAVRTAINLKDNASNYKMEVILYGNIEKYFGATGLKSVTFAILDNKEIGTNPAGSSDTPTSDETKSVSIANFNAAAESTDVWYKLTGTVKNLKDDDQYGNFDLVDETGSVYVYGLLSEKGGAKKKFQELVAAKGIKEGSKITIIGNRGSYNGKIEVVNAYFVSIEGEGGNEGGNGNEGGKDGSTIISVANFNAAAESTDVWYQLTGTISNLKDDDLYGNFDLTDETGTVYVYGVLSEKGGAKKKFQELVTAHGIKNGTTITIIGNRGSYTNKNTGETKIEVTNAYFVSASN